MNIGYYSCVLEQWKDRDENSWVKEAVRPCRGLSIECGKLYLKFPSGIKRVWNAIFRSEKEKYENTATISHFLEALQCDEQGCRISGLPILPDTFKSLEKQAIAGKPLSLRRVKAALEQRNIILRARRGNLNRPISVSIDLRNFVQEQSEAVSFLSSQFPKTQLTSQGVLKILAANRKEIQRAQQKSKSVRYDLLFKKFLQDEHVSEYIKGQIWAQLNQICIYNSFEKTMRAIVFYFDSAEKLGMTFDQAIEGIYMS